MLRYLVSWLSAPLKNCPHDWTLTHCRVPVKFYVRCRTVPSRRLGNKVNDLITSSRSHHVTNTVNDLITSSRSHHVTITVHDLITTSRSYHVTSTVCHRLVAAAIIKNPAKIVGPLFDGGDVFRRWAITQNCLACRMGRSSVVSNSVLIFTKTTLNFYKKTLQCSN